MIKMWSLKALQIKDAKGQREPLACRACLATDVVLYNIHENNLAEDYTLINGLSVSLQDQYPKQLCCYCAALLQKCAAFRKRCIKAYNLLTNISSRGKPLSISNIRDVQKSHQDLGIPYSISGIEKICYERAIDDEDHELTTTNYAHNDYNKQVTEIYQNNNENDDYDLTCDDNDMNTTNYAHNDYNKQETEIYQNENDDYDLTCDDIDMNIDDGDTNDINDKNTNINMTLGDLIDAEDDELEIVENKWLKGEYKIENLYADVDLALDALRHSKGLVEDDLEEFEEEERVFEEDERVFEEEEERVFEEIPKWHEQYRLTDRDLIALARKYDFNATFPDEEKQRQDVEEMKQKPGRVCKLCGSVFRSNWKFIKHTKHLHNPAAECVCKICKARFHNATRLEYHMLKHRVTYNCQHCDFNAKSLFEMPLHQARHKNHRFICDSCGKPFLTMGAMQKHTRKWHTVSKPWCDICGLSYVNQMGLDLHVRVTHKDVKVISCDKCSAQFLSDVALNRHSAYVCGVWSCKHCGNALGSEYLLKLHLLLLHQVPPYMEGPLTFDCWECLTSFHSTKGLENHSLTCGQSLHCVQCGDSFQDVKGLEQHAVRHDAVGLVCGECDEPCRTVSLLHTHYYRVHSNRHGYATRQRKKQSMPRRTRISVPKYFKNHSSKIWCVVDGKLVARTPEGRPVRDYADKACMCHVCGKAYASQPHLKLHLRLHAQVDKLQCERCPKQFPHKVALQQHMRCHENVEKPVQCPKCPAKLKSSLYRHMTTHHSTEKRHICDICGKAFKTSTSARLHITTVHMKIKPKPRVRRRKTKEKTEDLVYNYRIKKSGDDEEHEDGEYELEESEERLEDDEHLPEESEEVEYECVVYDDSSQDDS